MAFHFNDKSRVLLQNDYQIKSEISCGSFLTYTIEGNKIIISGFGEMFSFGYYNRPPWHSNSTEIEIVELPDEITTIGSYLLSDLIYLLTISIPKNVTRICINAFYHCINIKSITIDNDSEYDINRRICVFQFLEKLHLLQLHY